MQDIKVMKALLFIYLFILKPAEGVRFLFEALNFPTRLKVITIQEEEGAQMIQISEILFRGAE